VSETTTTTPAIDGQTLQAQLSPQTTAALGTTALVSLAPTGTTITTNVKPERAKELASKINIRDTQSIIGFGVEAQKSVSQVSDQMLQGVRTKDTGPAGEALNLMVHEMRGLDFKGLSDKPGLLSRLMRRASRVTLFLQQYETVEAKLSKTQGVLEGHRTQMLRGVRMLDLLYAKTMELLLSLDEQVAAVQYKLEEVNNNDIPEANQKAQLSQDMADTQAAADLIQARDALERKLHDLQLTRTITIQALPSIRIVQANEVGLSEKIQSQILNALPLWKRNMALAIEMAKTQQAAKASKAASDFTNEQLKLGANMLQQSNLAVRTEVERGIVDIESVKYANDKLIQTIEETIGIAQEGKNMRARAEKELAEAENKLKETLLSAANRQASMRAIA
jgi:uncharacterized protein YaaN involved in tellurite resistance